jgi:predicted peptidase
LNAGIDGHWGHFNFRGDVLWESQTFSDDRVLLHIPPNFDPKRPAVMVVFFHGHGASGKTTESTLTRQSVHWHIDQLTDAVP